MRITGMATGLDTDTLIKQMMKPYTMKVDKMKQDRQTVAWRQELYRDILSDTSSLRSTYFDLLKPDTNMLNKNNYSAFDVTATSSVAGGTAGVSASASVGAKAGKYTVRVETLATLATSAKIDGAAIAYTDPNKYTTNLENLGMSEASGELTFQYKNSSGEAKTSVITVSKTDTISQLISKISEGTSGAVNLNFSELTKKFTIESSEKGAGAVLNVTEKVLGTLGGADAVAGTILTSLKLPTATVTTNDGTTNNTITTATTTSGVNATNGKVYITPPGSTTETLVEKPSNNFSIDGVNYTISKANSAGDITTVTNITVAANSQKTFDKILGFIDKYNQLVEKISEKIDEKKQYKYLPLSDEEKKEMKEDEIKQWEIKAKVGLLKGDSNLDNMLTSMRRAFYDEVEGVGISLSEIGLSTSADTSQRGKIIVDEIKLKAAIETKGDKVADLFAKQSTTHPYYNADYTNEQTDRRYKEEGIFQKINDILQDYTRTGRNANGKKGILVEKAGLKGDINSLLSKDIIKKDEKINEMIRNLAARENKYYLQFSKLETAMNKMNSQSSWLTQQLSGGQ